jgi:hypothetical protein
MKAEIFFTKGEIILIYFLEIQQKLIGKRKQIGSMLYGLLIILYICLLCSDWIFSIMVFNTLPKDDTLHRLKSHAMLSTSVLALVDGRWQVYQRCHRYFMNCLQVGL